MLDFGRQYYPNNLTHIKLRGISGKKMSISFIWYLVVTCVTNSLGGQRTLSKVAAYALRGAKLYFVFV